MASGDSIRARSNALLSGLAQRFRVLRQGVGIAVQVNAFYGKPNPSCDAHRRPGPGYSLPTVSDVTVRRWEGWYRGDAELRRLGLPAHAAADLEGLPQRPTTGIRERLS